MLGESHELKEEFPEYGELMSELRENDSDFARLFDEYHAINAQVIRTEQGVECHSDFYTEDLKKKRALLKDQIYSLLRDQD